VTVADDDPRLAVDYRPRECWTSDGRHKQTYSRKQAKSRAKVKGSGLVAYRCHVCGHWHCATKPIRSIP